jgi:hypothetical protein
MGEAYVGMPPYSHGYFPEIARKFVNKTTGSDEYM